MISVADFPQVVIKKARRVFPFSLFSFWFLAVFVGLLSACESKPAETALFFSGETMGTSYHITLVPTEELSAELLDENIQRILLDLNQSMSTYIEDSELSRINRAPVGEWLDVSEDLLVVLEQAQGISKLSHGAFDVTIGPLVDLWGFGPVDTKDQVPSEEAIASARSTLGYQHIELRPDPPALRKNKALRIDLSAIAKGYGSDKLAQWFEEQGIHNYLIEIGGDLLVKGQSPRGEDWRIGVEQPRLEQGAVQQAISINNGGLATSGDYRNYYEVDGRRFSHIIDGRNGHPVDHSLASVTVIAESAAMADGLATALLVLGPEQAMALAKEKQLPVYLIVKTEAGFSTMASPAFEKFLAN